MFAGLHNCNVASVTIFDGAITRQPSLTMDMIESARPLTPRIVAVDLAPSMLNPHIRDGFLTPERLGGLQNIELNMQAYVERIDGPISIEPVWLDDLFRVGVRHVTLWYERDATYADFDESNITNILLDVAKALKNCLVLELLTFSSSKQGTRATVSTFDFKVVGSSVELNVPKEHPDVVGVKVGDFQEQVDDESRDPWIYGYLNFVHDWDAYYFKNDAMNDELTIMLKRPVEEFAAFRLKRGRLLFETEKNDG